MNFCWKTISWSLTHTSIVYFSAILIAALIRFKSNRDSFEPQFTSPEAIAASNSRERYAIALKAACQLGKAGNLSAAQKGALKDAIFRNDDRVSAAIEVFELDNDVEEVSGHNLLHLSV